MRSRCLQTRRRLVIVLAVFGWILHIRQFIDRLFDVCSGNVLVLGIISNILHCVRCWKVFEYCRCVVIRDVPRV